MFRFAFLITSVLVAYTVGQMDAAPSGPPSANRTYASMRTNDDGIGSDVKAIVRDGAVEIGQAVKARVGDPATAKATDADAMAQDITRAASRIARKAAGEIVIRACPSLGLECDFSSGT